LCRCTNNRTRRSDDLQNFVTLEEFMLSQQDEDQRQSTMNRSVSPRTTPLINDHVHVQHRNFNDNAIYSEQNRQLNDVALNNDLGNIYGRTKDEILNNSTVYTHLRNTNAHVQATRQLNADNFIAIRSEGNCINDKFCNKCTVVGQKRMWDTSSNIQKRKMQELAIQQTKHGDSIHWRSVTNPNKDCPGHSRGYEHNVHVQHPNHENHKTHDYPSRDIGMLIDNYKTIIKRHNRNIGNLNTQIKL